VHQLVFESVSRVYDEIGVRPTARERWSKLYSVSAEGIVTKQNFSWLFCASGNVAQQNYEACVERTQKDRLNNVKLGSRRYRSRTRRQLRSDRMLLLPASREKVGKGE
jgi:hypothetical protein